MDGINRPFFLRHAFYVTAMTILIFLTSVVKLKGRFYIYELTKKLKP